MGMAWWAERHQPVKIEVRAPLASLDDVVDLEAAPRPQAWHLRRTRRNPRAPPQRRTDAQRVRYNRVVGRRRTAMLRSLLLH